MEKNQLIQNCNDIEKSLDISMKLLRLLGVIVSEVKKFLTEVDLDSEPATK